MIEVAAFRGAKCWKCKRQCRWTVGNAGHGPLRHAVAFAIHACGVHVARALARVQKAIDDWNKKPRREKYPHTTYTGEG